MYPAEIVNPMKTQLTERGFEDLTTSNSVENALKKEGLSLLVINSVCGCAAGSARPAVLMSLDNEKTPDNLYTVFAGYDKEAVEKAREYLYPFPPSSPAIAVFKNGELTHMIERHHIEGNTAETIAEHLKDIYNNS